MKMILEGEVREFEQVITERDAIKTYIAIKQGADRIVTVVSRKCSHDYLVTGNCGTFTLDYGCGMFILDSFEPYKIQK
ncbi:MAG TPA: hypothetical protein VIK26_10960 [Clostridium sp.]